MIALIQRVTQAQVTVDDTVIAQIDCGLLALIGVEPNDSTSQADRLCDRLLGYRVFADADDKMNLSLKDVKGGLMLVPQFTLAADTRKGMRPSFSSAAAPATGERLFNYLVQQSRQQYSDVSCGHFGADMQVALVNDGPVTFWLQTD